MCTHVVLRAFSFVRRYAIRRINFESFFDEIVCPRRVCTVFFETSPPHHRDRYVSVIDFRICGKLYSHSRIFLNQDVLAQMVRSSTVRPSYYVFPSISTVKQSNHVESKKKALTSTRKMFVCFYALHYILFIHIHSCSTHCTHTDNSLKSY